MAPTSNPKTPSPTPTWLDAAPAVGKEVVETAATEEVEVEVEVTTGPGPETLGLEAVMPPDGGEPPPLGPFEAGGDAGGGMIVVAETAMVVTEAGEDAVTAPVEAVLSSVPVHKVVVAVPTIVVSVSVLASEFDEAEPEEDMTTTLGSNVVAAVAEEEVAV